MCLIRLVTLTHFVCILVVSRVIQLNFQGFAKNNKIYIYKYPFMKLSDPNYYI